jgi:hypothetical protein
MWMLPALATASSRRRVASASSSSLRGILTSRPFSSSVYFLCQKSSTSWTTGVSAKL